MPVASFAFCRSLPSHVECNDVAMVAELASLPKQIHFASVVVDEFVLLCNVRDNLLVGVSLHACRIAYGSWQLLYFHCITVSHKFTGTTTKPFLSSRRPVHGGRRFSGIMGTMLYRLVPYQLQGEYECITKRSF